ncbi:MAG: hypothetical protein ACFWTZ_07070 [Burkholderia sp.]|jgi:hypothetical protein
MRLMMAKETSDRQLFRSGPLARRAAAALCAAAALLASGCASAPAGHAPAESIPADAMRRPVDMTTVCLINAGNVKSEALRDALSEGIRTFGAVPRELASGEGPQSCSFVLAYEVKTEGEHFRYILFQTFENAIPRLEARGTPEDGPFLSFDDVSDYTVRILSSSAARIKKRGGTVIQQVAAKQ